MVTEGWSAEMGRRADRMLADPSGYFKRATKAARREAAADLTKSTRSSKSAVSRAGKARSVSGVSASGMAATKF